MEKQETRKRLKDVFKELRSLGYLARMNYLCCRSCAGYQMCGDVSKLISSGKKTKEQIKGCVYFHSQDNDNWKADGNMFLSYGMLYTAEHGNIGVDEKETGNTICKLLKQKDIPYKWDGDVGKRILVAYDKAHLR